MSQDARNSIYLWVGAIVLAGLFWASLRFDLLPEIPDRWLWPMLTAMLALNVLNLIRDVLRRRRSRDS